MNLSSTQIGAIAENLVVNGLMIESSGRLSLFQPVADDDGIDVLIYDKFTGKSLPIQIKARTRTVKKRGSEEYSNTVQFELRKAAHREDRHALLLCILLSEDLRSAERAWLLPLADLPELTNAKESKYVIRANKQLTSSDRYKEFQCANIAEVGKRLIAQFEQ